MIAAKEGCQGILTLHNDRSEGVKLIAKHGKVIVPGRTRMEATIRHVFDWRGLPERVEEHCRTCEICQMTKKQRKQYGLLPPKDAETIPWKRVNVDVVGPYTRINPAATHRNHQ